MKKGKLVSFLVVVLIVSLSCNFLFPPSTSHQPDIDVIDQISASLPVLDPQAPMPSPGAAALRILAAAEPGVTAFVSDIEAGEQAAMKAAVEDLKAKLGSTNNIQHFSSVADSPFGTPNIMIPAAARLSTTGDILLMSYNQLAVIQQAESGLSAASLVGSLASMFTDTFAVPEAMPTQSFSITEKEGNATTVMSVEIGRSQDGSTHFNLGLQSEGTKNGVSAKTDTSATIDGQRCPTADGQVSFTIKGRLGAESGGTGTTQDLTTFVRATVNDDGEIASSTFDLIQGTQQLKGERQIYVEAGMTVKYGSKYSDKKLSNFRVNQNTDNATTQEINDLNESGLTGALELGISSLVNAQNAWQGGKCVKIVAASPGTVKPGSTTSIPVNVISIFDGSNVPSKLNAALTGAESIDPTSLAKTPGTLIYTAPGENGKSATILLTATSKRGKAKLELSASTGGKFSASGTWGVASLTGIIDSLNNPFTLASTGGGDGSCNGEVMFSGGSTGGGVSCSQTCGGLFFEGDGSYTITITEDGGTISGDCSSYLPASGGLDIPNTEPINVTLQRVP